MTIRRAVFDDMDRILQLYHQLYETVSEQQPNFYCEAEQEREYVLAQLEREDAAFFLLETESQEKEVIGFLLVTMEERPHRPFFVDHRYARVVDILVEPFYRGAGWGQLLMKAAESWAREREAEYIEMDILSNSESAVSFCERYGFVQRKNTMLYIPE